MEAEQSKEVMPDAQSNLRSVPRFDVNESAVLTLVSHGSRCQCRILDLSLGGCRLHTDDKMVMGVSTRVEVNFKVNGIVLRFPGVVQWSDGRHQVGIRFAEMSSRRRDELAEILCEVNEEKVAREAKESAAEVAAAEQVTAEKVAQDLLWEQQAQRVREDQESREKLSALEEIRSKADEEIHRKLGEQEEHRKKKEREALLLSARFRSAVATPLPVNPVPVSTPVAPIAKTGPWERRTQTRHEVDTAAVIQLININSKQTGRILDLSMGGCRIKTDARFPVGIYRRAEAEFYLEGLPFRLGGVIQDIQNGNMVGIRFLDLSARKKEQLEQLIREIETSEESLEKDSE